MSIATVEPSALPAPAPVTGTTYLNVAYGVKSWLLTKDHKRIAILYLVSITLMFFVGGFAITIARLNLVAAPDLRLVALRHQLHLPVGRAGAGHGDDAGNTRARAADRRLRPGPGRRSASVPAPVLVLFAPGRLHHDPAGDGRGQ